jgi:hypothetical protein
MNKTRSGNKREISKEHWDMSFDRYFSYKADYNVGIDCGYCLGADDCDDCLIDKIVCSGSPNRGYYGKMKMARTDKTRRKYLRLIREYILEEGRRLHYITLEQERVAEEVLK